MEYVAEDEVDLSDLSDIEVPWPVAIKNMHFGMDRGLDGFKTNVNLEHSDTQDMHKNLQ